MSAAHPEIGAPRRVNPGETLRQAREARGLTLAEAAGQLNLTAQRLGQLEAGAFDQLPGHTFARGYVRAYAKLLGLDPSRLVLEFDQFTGSDAEGSRVHSLGRIEEPLSQSQRVLRFFGVALLVTLLALAGYWWQGQSEPGSDRLAGSGIEQVEVEGADGTTQIHVLDEPEDQALLAAQTAPEPGLGEAALAFDESAESAPASVSGETAPASSEASTEIPESAPQAVAQEVAPTPAAEVSAVLAADQGRVQIAFTADCWTQVTDANGQVLVSALKREGESLDLVGKAPMELRLGYARGAQVSYNGAAVDVAPFTSGETARLKLGGQ